MGELDDIRGGFELTHRPSYLVEALHVCRELNIAPPDWVVQEVGFYLLPLDHVRPGRGQRSPEENGRQLAIDILRWQIVEEHRAHGKSLEKAYEAAAKEAGSPVAGSEPTMRNSYRRASLFWSNLGSDNDV